MNKKNKVFHISTVHYWQDARIFDKECKSLAAAGYDTTLIIQFHSGKKIKDNITIIGLPIAQTKLQRLTKVMPKMFAIVLKQNKNAILHLHDPELLFFGVIFKILGFKVIYDVHEDLPKDVLDKDWIPTPIRGILSLIVDKIEFLTTATFDGLITVTPAINRRFTHANKVMVRNFPKTDLFLNQPDAEITDYVIYVGDIREVRGAKEMVKAISKVSCSLRLKLGGRIHPESLKKEMKSLDEKNRIDFLGWIPHQQISSILSKALCGLVVLHPLDGYKEAYSVKMFEYMAAGIPVIASDFPLWRSIISETECGILVDPLNSDQIAAAIDFLANNPRNAKIMGERGRTAVQQKYSWGNEEKKLLMLYKEIDLAM